jgi:hypothetical protein
MKHIIAILAISTAVLSAQAEVPTILNLVAHFKSEGMPLNSVTFLEVDDDQRDNGLIEYAGFRHQDEQTLKVYYIGTLWRVKDQKAMDQRKLKARLFKYPIYVNGLIAMTLDEADPVERKKLEDILQSFKTKRDDK